MPSLRRSCVTLPGPPAPPDRKRPDPQPQRAAITQSDNRKYKKKKKPVPTRASTYRIEITTGSGGSEIERLAAPAEGLERSAWASIGTKPDPT